jgi:hypothetical protein
LDFDGWDADNDGAKSTIDELAARASSRRSDFSNLFGSNALRLVTKHIATRLS